MRTPGAHHCHPCVPTAPLLREPAPRERDSPLGVIFSPSASRRASSLLRRVEPSLRSGSRRELPQAGWLAEDAICEYMWRFMLETWRPEARGDPAERGAGVRCSWGRGRLPRRGSRPPAGMTGLPPAAQVLSVPLVGKGCSGQQVSVRLRNSLSLRASNLFPKCTSRVPRPTASRLACGVDLRMSVGERLCAQLTHDWHFSRAWWKVGRGVGMGQDVVLRGR